MVDYAEMHKTIVNENILEYITKTTGSVPEMLAYLLMEAAIFNDEHMETYLKHQMRLLTSSEAERTKDLIEAMKAAQTERERDVDVYEPRGERRKDDKRGPEEGRGVSKLAGRGL